MEQEILTLNQTIHARLGMKEESFLKSCSLSKISNGRLRTDSQDSTRLNSYTREIDEPRAMIPICHDPKITSRDGTYVSNR